MKVLPYLANLRENKPWCMQEWVPGKGQGVPSQSQIRKTEFGP